MEETRTKFTCQYCDKGFQKENSLAVHLCEPKRRWREEKEAGVQIGLQAYLRFYEITQGSAKLKTFDNFVRSTYYRAFVKFGRYCVSIRAVNVPRFLEWLIQKNKKIDHWCRDSIYTEYLSWYVLVENPLDAVTRAQQAAQQWGETTGNPSKDYLRYGNTNLLCYAITTGRVTAWVLYHCDSGNDMLANLGNEQISIIWPWIETDAWQHKFRDYPADTEYVRKLLTDQGW